MKQKIFENRVERFKKRTGIQNLTPIYEEGEANEPYFSWHPCQCCGDTDGGDREDCNGYNPTKKKICGPYSVCSDCVYYAEYGYLPGTVVSRY